MCERSWFVDMAVWIGRRPPESPSPSLSSPSPLASLRSSRRTAPCGDRGALRRTLLRGAVALHAIGCLRALLLLLLLFRRPRRRNIQPPVNRLRYRHDLRTQLLLDFVQVESVLVRDEVDRQTQVSEPTTAADAVEVRLRVLREVEVDDDVDGLDIDTASEEVRADEVAANAVTEVVENAVAVGLQHLGVRVET